MRYTWFTLLLVCALVQAEVAGEAGPATEVAGEVAEVTDQVAAETGLVFNAAGQNTNVKRQQRTDEFNLPENSAAAGSPTEVPIPVATTRPPPRTLDRQAAELAWGTWLKSPESGNPNGPPRRITTKSLFITPLVCPKGQRLDRNGCVQTVTVNKDEHERILLEQLNALFVNSTPSNNGDVLYDYGEEEPGPLQLSIPIGLDPNIQNRDSIPGNIDKKGDNMLNDASIEAELELLKLQQSQARLNDSGVDNTNILSHNVLNNLLTYSDKPKRDSPMANSSETGAQESTEQGQKELVYGHVNVDPVLYDTETQNDEAKTTNEPVTEIISINTNKNATNSQDNNENPDKSELNAMSSLSTKDGDATKLNPENDYSDIGEAIKLISRYAEVSTDDNFSKEEKQRNPDDSILGTRTKLQYRRKPKPLDSMKESLSIHQPSIANKNVRGRPGTPYSYPNENFSPPANYPFKRLQDYWPGRTQIGGVYNNVHQNPKRHHHSYPHYFRPRGYPADYTDLRTRSIYPGFQQYPEKIMQHHASPLRSHSNDQDIYSLLGLRHWFSSDGASKR